MSKATVIANHGEGEYTVSLEYDHGRLDNLVAWLTQELTNLEAQINTAFVTALDIRNSELYPKVTELNLAIIDFASDNPRLDAKRDIVTRLTAEATEIRARFDAASRHVAALRGIKLSMLTERTRMTRARTDAENTAEVRIWCADYTTSLTPGTEVAVALVPGERSTMVIHPQHSVVAEVGLGGHIKARDGQLMRSEGMSPAQALLNYILMPGWQRWMPTYRTGVVNGEPTLTHVPVVLDTEFSSVRSDSSHFTGPFPVSPNTGATIWVEPVYMDCGASIFQDGDAVLVMSLPNASRASGAPMDRSIIANETAFDADNLRVIGFVTHPRYCRNAIQAYAAGHGYSVKYALPLEVEAETECSVSNFRYDAIKGRCYHDESWSSDYSFSGSGERTLEFSDDYPYLGAETFSATQSVAGGGAGVWTCNSSTSLTYQQTDWRTVDTVVNYPRFGQLVVDYERVNRSFIASYDYDAATQTHKQVVTYEMEFAFLDRWIDASTYILVGYSFPRTTKTVHASGAVTFTGTRWVRCVLNGEVYGETTEAASIDLGQDSLYETGKSVSDTSVGASACTAATDWTGAWADKPEEFATNIELADGLRWVGGLTEGDPQAFALGWLPDQSGTKTWGVGIPQLPYESGMTLTVLDEQTMNVALASVPITSTPSERWDNALGGH